MIKAFSAETDHFMISLYLSNALKVINISSFSMKMNEHYVIAK